MLNSDEATYGTDGDEQMWHMPRIPAQAMERACDEVGCEMGVDIFMYSGKMTWSHYPDIAMLENLTAQHTFIMGLKLIFWRHAILRCLKKNAKHYDFQVHIMNSQMVEIVPV